MSWAESGSGEMSRGSRLSASAKVRGRKPRLLIHMGSRTRTDCTTRRLTPRPASFDSTACMQPKLWNILEPGVEGAILGVRCHRECFTRGEMGRYMQPHRQH